MVATSDLGSDAERRGGSSPFVRTKAIVFLTVAFLRSKGFAPPVAPWATCLRWVAMCHVAMQLWVCAESNYLCKHKVTLNTHPQSTIARTSLPSRSPLGFSGRSSPRLYIPGRCLCQSISVCSRSAERSSSLVMLSVRCCWV